MINKQRAGQTETQRSATHLSTCTVYQIFEHNDKHTNQDKYKQGHTKVCYILSHCTSYLKTRINGQTKTNRQTKTNKQRHKGLLHTCQLTFSTRYLKTKTNKQTKTKTNRDTQRSATHISTFTLYQLFEDKDKWTNKDKQTNKDKDKQRHKGLLHTCQLTL